ncbi:D-3-phosphoglycerate dehydrogenase [Formosa agariphila KMM 3901]|uniref:D-3-phosphoglycerate dehydrogenase n=1 Tax=Formosa agariphila (strain DSM 15362 / KCTC 12365 / LMG 23005 / KMM 3901 / M-2Alg 35-1) TaxID=1347342 RepID=T2KIP3_FORAG|nr:D-2-hydroxyacid dehydrogenase [Formosa agariphila]CDF77834.1 D-3-phosphoglycerate dehydrogenase [Formosa agariphila KMM 3901]
MKLVVLDGYTLNPGDLSWDALKALTDVTIYDRTDTDTDAIVKAIGDAEAVITNKVPIQKAVLDQLPQLKYIGVTATGYNIIDIEAAKNQDVTVTNVPAYSTASVAQFTMALLLELCHHVGDHSTAVHSGQWQNSKDFTFWNSPLIELEGKTMGIIGFGQIGKATAALAQAFGLNILVFNRTVYPEYETETCRFVELNELLKTSDVVSLHCPMTDDTAGLIDAETISKMKSSAFIINTSRGGLVVEADLAEALNSDKIAGAAVDVVSAEPIAKDNPLLGAKNCIITPHIAWAPLEARTRCMQIAVNNVEAFLKGELVNVVS